MIFDGKVYALSPGVLTEIALDGSGKTVYNIPTSFFSIITDGSKLILFSDSEARYFEHESIDAYDQTEEKH